MNQKQSMCKRNIFYHNTAIIYVADLIKSTNNKKYWSTPCNGTTSRADMCGGIYKEQHCDHAPILPPNKHCRRVNYFCSLMGAN